MLWGVQGILFASIAAILLTYFWYEPMLLYRDYFKANVMLHYRDTLIYWVLYLSLTFGSRALSSVIHAGSWVGWILKAAVIFIGCNLVYVLVFFRSPRLRYLMTRLIKKEEDKHEF